MNSEIKIFENSEFGKIRALKIDGEPWVVGKDVAEALGYKDTKSAIIDHIDAEDKKILKGADLPPLENHIPKSVLPVNFVRGDIPNRGLTIINESGLYSLILSSKLESAKKFKHWVTSEVLPAIRKDGEYKKPETREQLFARALNEMNTVLQEKDAEIQKKDKEIEAMRPKAVFADAVATSKSSVLIGQLARILRQNGVDTGQNRLFKWLREHEYLISRRCEDYNMPTQRAMEMGLFEIKVSTVNKQDGTVLTTRTTKVTGKGQTYFVSKLLAEKA